MTRIRTPRILTIDDGEQFNNRHKQSDYSFVFSDNVEDWQATPAMRHKRKIGRVIMKKYYESKAKAEDVLPEEAHD